MAYPEISLKMRLNKKSYDVPLPPSPHQTTNLFEEIMKIIWWKFEEKLGLRELSKKFREKFAANFWGCKRYL